MLLPTCTKQLLIVASLAVGVASTGLAFYAKHPPGAEVVDYSTAAIAGAGLTDQHGKTVTARSLKNKLVLMNFFFTSCNSACPIQTRVLKSVQESLDPDIDVEIVSVSISPLQDDVETIKKYTDKYGIFVDHWRFASTTLEKTDFLVQTFGVSIDNATSAQPDHRNMAYLFSKEGNLMQQYRLTPGIEQRLKKEINQLAQLAL